MPPSMDTNDDDDAASGENRQEDDDTRIRNEECSASASSNVEDSSAMIAMKSYYYVLALYKFAQPVMSMEEVRQLRDHLERTLKHHQARGNILLATEGINGTICFPNNVDNNDDNNNNNEYPAKTRGSISNQSMADGSIMPRLQMWLLQQFPKLRTRLSCSNQQVFVRLRIRIKSEIITMRATAVTGPATTSNDDRQSTLSLKKQGEHPSLASRTSQQNIVIVPPGSAWDELLNDPECLVLDVRNDYESAIGSFRHSVIPNTNSFCEFPEWFDHFLEERNVDSQHARPYSKVAMFCTGGIRCEKAAPKCAEILYKHYTEAAIHSNQSSGAVTIYQLEGGILGYLDTVPASQSYFDGECYVFDQRTAVSHGLQPSQTYSTCFACRHVLGPQDRLHEQHHEEQKQQPNSLVESSRQKAANQSAPGNDDQDAPVSLSSSSSFYVPGVVCPYCLQDPQREDRRQRYEDRQRQWELLGTRPKNHA